MYWAGNVFSWVSSGFSQWYSPKNQDQNDEKSSLEKMDNEYSNSLKQEIKNQNQSSSPNNKIMKMAIDITEACSVNNAQLPNDKDKITFKVNDKTTKNQKRSQTKGKSKTVNAKKKSSNKKSRPLSAKKAKRIPQIQHPPVKSKRNKKIVRVKGKKAVPKIKAKVVGVRSKRALASKRLKVINTSKSQSAKISGKKRKRSAIDNGEAEKPKMTSPKRRRLTSPTKTKITSPTKYVKKSTPKRSTRKAPRKSFGGMRPKAARKFNKTKTETEERNVEKIYGERVENGQTEYLMKFKGCLIAESEWRKADDSVLCQACIAQYKRDLRKPSKKKYMQRIVRDINKKRAGI